MQDYRKLYVWQKAHKLAVDTYTLGEYFRRPDAWKLRDQIFDAVVSIPANIAEGSGRGSNADFKRFLWYSNGSCNEFESDVLLARGMSTFSRNRSIRAWVNRSKKSGACSPHSSIK